MGSFHPLRYLRNITLVSSFASISRPDESGDLWLRRLLSSHSSVSLVQTVAPTLVLVVESESDGSLNGCRLNSAEQRGQRTPQEGYKICFHTKILKSKKKVEISYIMEKGLPIDYRHDRFLEHAGFPIIRSHVDRSKSASLASR